MTDLMTLEEAAESLHATVTVSALRAAVREGRLPRRKLGRRYYLYPGDLEILLCQDESQPDSTSDATKASGSSETERDRSGLDMVTASLNKLKAHSVNTSRSNRRQSATVQHIRTT